MLDAAVSYAARGWPVLPLEPGTKHPLGRLVPHGLKNASTDAGLIRTWWKAEPRANIGLVTGAAFDVLDVDGPDALERLEAAGGPAEVHEVGELTVCDDDVEGPTVATPRGWHVYVSPTGRGNTVKLGGLDGVDWRGRGGYVVAPPSVRDDGGTWEWTNGTPVDLGPDTPIVTAPGWVLALFGQPRRLPVAAGWSQPRHAGRTGYGAAAMERELGRLAVAVTGTRNHQLNASAYSLGQLVAAGLLDAEEVVIALLAVARQIGLSDQECLGTIRSGMRAGMSVPRRVA
jgi:hypothetical protein